MQISISFISEKNIVLPIHYNNIIQAFIYNNIDNKLSRFLHDKGYITNGRSFKMFTYSRVIGDWRAEEDRFNFGKKAKLIISSPLDNFCKSVANSMLQSNHLFIGQNSIQTERIQIDNQIVDKDEIIIDTLSPIVVYSTFIKPDNSKYTCYFMPREPDFNRLVKENLVRKCNAVNTITNGIGEPNVEVIPLGKVRQHLTYYKKTIVKGASGRFLIKGRKELLQIGVDAGFGSKNSQGFGCVKII
ncbi:CRISPR-associated endoribonuclease Cas6 [Lutispora saccharofermentans]|uniref:CRISPR-associated endoribonuclease n=1 Tax=Lutispora saccharofermentans TaxID=3024236 RepID=A0ABT1ND43_9FIRM|nr:CRISPR-associated endoribonuclease Cas6 [Lutispora saccharofermentans]